MIDRLFEFYKAVERSRLHEWCADKSHQKMECLFQSKSNYEVLFDNFGKGTHASQIPNLCGYTGGDRILIASGLNCPRFWQISEEKGYAAQLNRLKRIFLEQTDMSYDDISIPEVCGLYGEVFPGGRIIPPLFYRFGVQMEFIKNKIEKKDGLIFLEIGAGYGGFPSLVKRSLEGSRYVIVDIAHSIMIQSYFLEKLGYRVVLCNEVEDIGRTIDEGEFDFLMILPERLKEVRDSSVDLAMNMDSLPEMNRETVAYYVDHIARVAKSFYQVNREYDPSHPCGSSFIGLCKSLSERMTEFDLVDDRYQVGEEGQFFFSVGMGTKYRIRYYERER